MATTKELEEQLERAKEDIRTLSRMAGQRAREEAGAYRAGVDAALDQLSEESRALFDQAAAEGRRMRATSEDTIRGNPFGSVALAFAAGVLASALFNRR